MKCLLLFLETYLKFWPTLGKALILILFFSFHSLKNESLANILIFISSFINWNNFISFCQCLLSFRKGRVNLVYYYPLLLEKKFSCVYSRHSQWSRSGGGRVRNRIDGREIRSSIFCIAPKFYSRYNQLCDQCITLPYNGNCLITKRFENA